LSATQYELICITLEMRMIQMGSLKQMH